MNGLEFIAPMVVAVTLIVTTGAVVLLRPLSKRMGELLDVMTKQKSAIQPAEVEQLRIQVSAVESRLALLEERQRFTDQLLESRTGGESLPEIGRGR